MIRVNDVYAPVAKMQTVNFLFSFFYQFGLIIGQMDVVATLLNGEVISDVYLGKPKDYSDGTKFVNYVKHCTVYEKV